jgi:hypothetical protein
VRFEDIVKLVIRNCITQVNLCQANIVDLKFRLSGAIGREVRGIDGAALPVSLDSKRHGDGSADIQKGGDKKTEGNPRGDIKWALPLREP